VNLTYEYRLYPRKAEVKALQTLLEQGREVYNLALAQSKTVYETSGEHQGGINQWDYFREWRKQPGTLLNASSLQHLLRRLDKAYAAFFSRIKEGKTPVIPVSNHYSVSTVWTTPTAMAASWMRRNRIPVSTSTFRMWAISKSSFIAGYRRMP